MSIQTNRNSISSLQMSRVATAILAGGLILIAPLAIAFAQSSDRNAPTHLTTHDLSGRGVAQQDKEYYYKFTAKPGKINIILDVKADNTNGNSVAVEISLQTPEGNEIETFSTFATQGETGHIVKKLEFPSETPVIMVLRLTGGSTAGYNYRIQINGALS